ncbi:pyridoxamine 5'-phosphate oxidase family protein [Gemmatimonas sp.]|uniref:pyridoxamine 5'-phosphate oxidase family protein n=1 Tax=Gemmatimonas sp. TaxID=1962908 RepID=UPI00286D7334|nr:pyridoxamine 5'-phosphate oxidase family protein [Gemmatimonas sp.]
MNHHLVISVALSVVLAAAPAALWAQAAPAAPTPAALEAAARTIVRSVPYPTFITTDAKGHPQARTVQPMAPDSGWAVWFATNPRTRKVREIARHPHVVLHYFDPVTQSYVALAGRARVVRDRPTKDAHWNSAWSSFYPDRDTSVVLIVVQAERLEIVSAKLGVEGDKATWRPPTLRLRPARAVPARAVPARPPK